MDSSHWPNRPWIMHEFLNELSHLSLIHFHSTCQFQTSSPHVPTSMFSMLLHVITVVCSCIVHVTSAFHCVGTCYSGAFPKEKDIVIGKGMDRQSYKNISTGNPKKCFSSCVNDCRCKAFQIKDKASCELLHDDKNSNADKFIVLARYVYYDLQQELYKGVILFCNSIY